MLRYAMITPAAVKMLPIRCCRRLRADDFTLLHAIRQRRQLDYDMREVELIAEAAEVSRESGIEAATRAHAL